MRNLDDIKDFQKLVGIKANVSVYYYDDYIGSRNVIKLFKEAAVHIESEGTMVLVDCWGTTKKMCKRLKIANDPIMKHFFNNKVLKLCFVRNYLKF